MPSTEDKPSENKQPRPKKHEDPSLFCPNCSSRLSELKCKLWCEKCGYYMSCADYY